MKVLRSSLAVGGAIAALFIVGPAEPAARGQERLLKSQLKDGREVRAAFEEVVREINRAMVAVFVNGRPVSLGGIVSPDGFILTKASELAEPVRCRLRDGREFDASIVGIHDRYDVALLKIACSGLPCVEWAEAGDPQVGQWLATPGMEAAPAAVGIVSVARRAIPPEKGVLGVQLSEGSPGPKVTHVVPSSAAARAGLQTGDVILRAGNQRITDPPSFDHLLRGFAPGDLVSVVVLRGNRQLSLRAVVGRTPPPQTTREYVMNRMSGRMSRRRAGFPQAIQHDTVLEPELCGGPVVDLSGRAIGLNIARAGRVETYAVPADVARSLIRELQYRLTPPVDNSAPRGEPRSPENENSLAVPPLPSKSASR